MKRMCPHIILGASLLTLSVLFYFMHYLIFKDAHHIFIYLVGDIAFVFIEVLLVTLIIHRVLEQRAKNARLEKLNMVIGAFFSEVGIQLLKMISQSDPQIERAQEELGAEGKSAGQKFARLSRFLREHDYSIEKEKQDWGALKALLVARKDFLLRLLENPTLLEHESFTEVLRTVFHLTEELEARESLKGLPDVDQKHLSGDVKRVYGPLALQWVGYVEHLENNYPYLFSLSQRTNPFDRKSSPIVQEL